MSFFQKMSSDKVAQAQKVEADKVMFKDKTTLTSLNDVKPGLKRPGIYPSSQQSQKKQKTNPGRQQQKGNLMNFFTQKKEQDIEVDLCARRNLSSQKPQLNDNVSIHVSEDKNTKSECTPSEEVKESSNYRLNNELEISHADGNNAEKKSLASAWKKLLTGPPPPPNCKAHNEPCLLRTVKKPGPNLGRKFFVCPRPEGHKNDPEARCNSFSWVVKTK